MRIQHRSIMQNVVNKYLPYKKYKLPDSVYINKELERRNDNFIDEIRVKKNSSNGI